MKVLLIGNLHPDAQKLLEENSTVTQMTNEEFASSKSLAEFEAIVLRTFTPLRKVDLDKLSGLKYVVSCSTGIDNIDVEELKTKDIELIHMPGLNANSAAEHTLYLMLAVMKESSPPAEIKGKTVGIIGFGMIGKMVAKKLLGFDAKVVAFDVIEQKPEVLEELKVEMKSFEEVLQQADVVSIHVPLNKYTKELINEKAFSFMKDNVFFVNASREEVVEEKALLHHADRFRGIALDVCSNEVKQELQKHKTAVITDHVGGKGEDSLREQNLEPVKKLLEKAN